MLGGYIGTILEVDLTRGKLTDISLEDNIPEMFLGGKGLALKMIYDRFKPDIDPLGPDNTIIFATGPATGTAYPTSGRYHVITMRSPLTGLVGSANSGGKWGPYLKFAGYDAVIIKGASATPVYLSIINGKAGY
jgi:aldehyde:ferredoxin oxidoreductase